ncbi:MULTISPECIES: carbohydrate ABC transporter permease [unclassified Curtobacterium]|uniref:carbohydrate ABC transporter permease n=1 Tax=unclassified Curtobacterium TaxID=257496 RepID=UPI000F4D1A98|nr:MULTISPECIES: carbohydrate ABC transporter permease [unclassified Curtobacterium]ROP64578.1 carbohydrate ABC transporter membrane protein 2 (CUT1 family) [Curtobacterium sp. ZW137]TCK63492.1 carbohydrate ABC transporter membrane protein 2 (CUT1 family) [Curtobacterium sp. PhB136]
MTAVSQSPLARAPRGAAPGAARGPRRSLLLWIAEHAALVALGVVTLAPIVFVILTSLMSSNQALTASILPRPFDFSNYARVFTELPLAQWFGNSALYAVLATAFMLVSSVPAAYALAQIKFKGANLIFTVIIVAMLLPPQVTAVPVYVMWSHLHLTGTLWPLILPNLLGDAFSIFLLRQFFMTIPKEYGDAARIDGCGEWRVLWRVIVPMARPGIASAAIFMFFNSWNDYYGPLLYASENQAAWPVAYGLATFRGQHGTDWSMTMAMTVVVMVPVVVIFFFAQKAFVEGIALTGVKG